MNNTSISERNANLHQVIEIIDCRIINNVAEDDGGGIYGTAKALLKISGSNTEISGNQAKANGGGIRISFGSQLEIQGGTIRNNQANVGGEANGGGGIAARNCRLICRNCTIEGNSTHSWGGGGIFVSTSEEGRGISGVLFEEALRNYGYSKALLQLDNVTITNNSATAGAGLYVLYIKYDVDIQIDNSRLGANLPSHPIPQKNQNVVLEDASNFPDSIINDSHLGSLSPLSHYRNTLSP
ncbi:hypothetical protein [Candidatus Paracaedibacter symbiosus]|uniref:hypothetical protein n=1 Tax=Candidatus Paracaedibacter symbiosus TaxID=244582 RepID=UPI0018DDE8B2|nr:hypothetical protein [Candidatus Paracaedibacter symbiosus]